MIVLRADVSLGLGKFCSTNLPAFHNLFVNALLEVNLSVDKLRSFKTRKSTNYCRTGKIHVKHMQDKCRTNITSI